MDLSTEQIAQLLQDLYAAAAQPENFTPFLEGFRNLTGASRAYLMMSDARSGAGIAAQANWDPYYAKLYAEQYAHDDPVFANAVAAMRRNGGDWAGDRTDILPDKEYFRHPSYHDMLVPVGDAHMCGSMMTMPGDSLGSIVLRRQRHQHQFESGVVSLIRLLGPHLKQALQLHGLLEQERSRSSVLASAVGAFDLAVIAIDAKGNVLEVSESAAAILRQGAGLTVRFGALIAADPAENRKLQQLLAGSAGTGSGEVERHARVLPVQHFGGRSRIDRTPHAGGALRITRTPPAPPINVTVTPFSSSEVLISTRPAALVFLHDASRQPLSRGKVLRSLYRITPTHVRLADALVTGLTVREAAEAMGIAEDTARFHLKSIFRVTGTTSQAEFLRLMLSLPGTRA